MTPGNASLPDTWACLSGDVSGLRLEDGPGVGYRGAIWAGVGEVWGWVLVVAVVAVNGWMVGLGWVGEVVVHNRISHKDILNNSYTHSGDHKSS